MKVSDFYEKLRKMDNGLLRTITVNISPDYYFNFEAIIKNAVFKKSKKNNKTVDVQIVDLQQFYILRKKQRFKQDLHTLKELLFINKAKVSKLLPRQILHSLKYIKTDNYCITENSLALLLKFNKTKNQKPVYMITFPVFSLGKYDIEYFNPFNSIERRKAMKKIMGYDNVFYLFNVIFILRGNEFERFNNNNFLNSVFIKPGALSPLFKEEYNEF